ncbi:MAG: FIST C-terminal domain-containing protein [Actinobacteria bacterium]|nr:FIST C-terminal domain-containing protein [Actinomycetota bacterium]
MKAFAAGLSEHPDHVEATAEAVGQVLEGLGGNEQPDLALLFVTPHHRDGLNEIAETVRRILRPGVLVGCAAQSVVGGTREIEGTPGISLWAGLTGPVVPFHLVAVPTPDGPTVTGWPDFPPDTSAMLVLGDAFTFPPDAFLRRVDEEHPDLPVVGGMALAGQTPGDNLLVLDDRLLRQGAIGVLLGPGVEVTTVVSQGCRPIGSPFAVTRAEGNVVYELAGRPALERLGEAAETMPEQDRALLTQGVHLGRVIDEQKDDFDRGDFLIRNVMGGDPNTGAIAVGDLIEVGATAQFQVRDAASADEDLRHLVGGRSADAALLFTCNGRGFRLFHEASRWLTAEPKLPVA